ncbi:hypothetical protein U1Q18_034118, partial [Sarracenia purpurea var. burkii]
YSSCAETNPHKVQESNWNSSNFYDGIHCVDYSRPLLWAPPEKYHVFLFFPAPNQRNLIHCLPKLAPNIAPESSPTSELRRSTTGPLHRYGRRASSRLSSLSTTSLTENTRFLLCLLQLLCALFVAFTMILVQVKKKKKNQSRLRPPLVLCTSWVCSSVASDLQPVASAVPRAGLHLRLRLRLRVRGETKNQLRNPRKIPLQFSKSVAAACNSGDRDTPSSTSGPYRNSRLPSFVLRRLLLLEEHLRHNPTGYHLVSHCLAKKTFFFFSFAPKLFKHQKYF